MKVNAYFLPSLIPNGAITNRNVVVVDILRATTTITTALQNGANSVTPCLTISQAESQKRSGVADVCGGERGGVQVEGFDFGNSPSEYCREAIEGKRIAFTTTNGTKAMEACKGAARILIGAFSNLSSIIQAVGETEFDVVCAGTDGEVTLEDVLFAGALIASAPTEVCEFNDQAILAHSTWTQLGNTPNSSDVFSALLQSRGGRNLSKLDRHEDIEFASRISLFEIVPELDPLNWSIRSPFNN